MQKLTLAFLTLFVLQIFSFAQQSVKINEGDSSWHNIHSIALQNSSDSTIIKLEVPKTNSKDIIVTHTGYSLLFNEKCRQANWVAYTLTKEKTKKLFNRSDKFIVDPQVTGTACNKDYSKSGYDRGHLAPAADMGWSSTAMAESFYYSNMSPQVPAFNRGIWKKLEELVRSWATENNTIYIATGPVLTSSLPTMGVNKISIPKYFYKVILDYSGQDIKGIGFIIPNLGSKEPIDHFAVSIDSVEKFTGIDFYPSLADKQEEIIEKNLCIKCWIWNTTKTRDIQKANNTTVAIPPINNTIGKTYIISSSKNSASTLQCSGITKSGGRCKRTTTNTNGRCYQH